MRVTFSAVGSLRRDTSSRQRESEVDMPDGATVNDLLQRLDITWGEIGIISVNGEVGDEDSVLHEGDHVELVAPIGGGWPV